MRKGKKMEEILEYVLEKALPSGLTYKTERRENQLYLPEIDVTITPRVAQVHENNVGLEFYTHIGKYDRTIYEWCTGWGTDVFISAGSATASFCFALMFGLRKMLSGEDPENFTTEFAGKRHEWKAYRGDMVTMGDPGEWAKKLDADGYWDVLKEEIKKRLGNQRMVYVKVFAARYPDGIVGECRIDDVAIPELGRKVADLLQQSPSDKTFTNKQFFFIVQNEETVIPSPFDGPAGRDQLEKIVVDYLKLFRQSKTEELYSRLSEEAEKITGDPVLANECVFFLPEICAIHALIDKFDGQYEVSDRVIFNMEDGPHAVYVSQLMDYDRLDQCICGILQKGLFGDQTKDLYYELLGCSSITKLLAEVKKKEVREPKPFTIYYNMGKGFALR